MIPVRVERRRSTPSLWREPWADVDWFGDVDRFFNRFFGTRDSGGWYPADIWEDTDTLHIELEMPGLTADQVQLRYEDGILRIEGEKKLPEHKNEYHLSERRFGKFVRTFHLPNVVDPDTIKASVKDGILYVSLSKRPETKARKIEITSE